MNKEPIDHLWNPISRIFKHQITGGIVLILAVAIAMIWANSPFHHAYHALWETHFRVGTQSFFLDKSLHHWINDALMSIFFFSVGLEMKREVLEGELSSPRQAALPIAAALGGMLVPAAFYYLVNVSSGFTQGWGVPMATDIAFTLGLLALISKRVPVSLKVFLTALAVVDDLGAVLVIAFFYTAQIDWSDLLIAGLFLAIMFGANRLGVRSYLFYLIIGFFGLWMAILFSGIHATVAGVLAAFTIPSRTKVPKQHAVEEFKDLSKQLKKVNDLPGQFVAEEQIEVLENIKHTSNQAATVSQRLEYVLSPVITFLVMPIFALANAGVSLEGSLLTTFLHPISLGVFSGLLLGKILGVSVLSHLLIALGWGELPKNSTWLQLYGVAALAGVGFTMSLFISDLAFSEANFKTYAKVGVLFASGAAACIGLGILYFAKPKLAGE